MFVNFKRDPGKFEELKARCREIHQAIALGDASEWENDPLFAPVLFTVFLPETTTERDAYLNLYRGRSDRPSDIAGINRELQVTELFEVATGNYILKDPSKPLNEAPWQTLLGVVREVNATEAGQMAEDDITKLGEDLLKHWQTGNVYQNREDLMRRLYRYFRISRDQTLPSSLANIPDIMAHKQFIGDTVYDLAGECIREYAKTNQEAYRAALAKMFRTRIDNPKGAAAMVGGMLEKYRDSPEKGRAHLGKILRIEDEEILDRVWNEVRDKKNVGEIATVLGSLKLEPQEGKEVAKIVQQLQGSDYKIMQSEISQKYEFKEGREAQRFRFASKRKAHSVAGHNMGVCVAEDAKLWNNPNFMNLIIFDENNRAWGGMHVLVIEEGGKRYLTLPGINPSSLLLARVASEVIFDRMMDYAKALAKELKCEAVLIPKSSVIHSNRSKSSVIAEKGYSDHLLKEVHPFSYSFILFRRLTLLPAPKYGPPLKKPVPKFHKIK